MGFDVFKALLETLEWRYWGDSPPQMAYRNAKKQPEMGFFSTTGTIADNSREES